MIKMKSKKSPEKWKNTRIDVVMMMTTSPLRGVNVTSNQKIDTTRLDERSIYTYKEELVKTYDDDW